MAGLTGLTIAATYNSLLRTLADGGITTSLQVIEDGAGDDTCLQLSTKQLLVKSATDIAATFEVQNSSGHVLLTCDTDGTNEEVVINNGGIATVDFRVETDNEDEALFVDAGADTVYINKGENAVTTSIHNTNDVAMTVGSAGVIFNEDGNSSNDFRIESNNYTHILFVDAGNNRIGINTSAPDELLHISADSNPTIRIERNDDTISIDNEIGVIEFEHQEIGNTGLCARILCQAGTNDGDGEFSFEVGKGGSTASALFIQHDKSIGIGTTAPAEVLEVAGGSDQGIKISTYDADSLTTNPYLIFLKSKSNTIGAHVRTVDNDELGSIGFAGCLTNDSTAKTGASIIGRSVDNAGSDYVGAEIAFYTGTNAAPAAQAMTIYSDGNVGIGVTAPDALLHVSGAGISSQITSTNSNGAKLEFSDTTSNTTRGFIGADSTRCFTSYDTGGALCVSVSETGNNLIVGSTGTFPTALVSGITIHNGTAPSAGLGGSASFHCAGGEMFVSDGSDNQTQLSPHTFALFEKPDEMAWSYYSINKTAKRRINVDMYGVIKKLEELSGEKFIYVEDWDNQDPLEKDK